MFTSPAGQNAEQSRSAAPSFPCSAGRTRAYRPSPMVLRRLRTEAVTRLRIQVTIAVLSGKMTAEAGAARLRVPVETMELWVSRFSRITFF